MTTPTPPPTTEPEVAVDVPPVPDPIVFPAGNTTDYAPNLCTTQSGAVVECDKTPLPLPTEPLDDFTIDGPIDVTTPFQRGEPIYLGTTPAGGCVSGSTQWTYEPCGDALTTTTAVVGVDPATVQLPATGADLNIGIAAGLFVLVGWIMVWKTRPRPE